VIGHDGTDPLPRRVVPREGIDEALLVFTHELGVDGGDQRLLVGKVMVERPDADVGFPPNLIERGNQWTVDGETMTGGGD
jgi:hypothetical protein